MFELLHDKARGRRHACIAHAISSSQVLRVTGERRARSRGLSALLERYHTREKCRAFGLRRFGRMWRRRSCFGVSSRSDTLLFSRYAHRVVVSNSMHSFARASASLIEARTQAERASPNLRDDDNAPPHAPHSRPALRNGATPIALSPTRCCCMAETWRRDSASSGCARQPKQLPRASSFAHRRAVARCFVQIAAC